MTRLLVMTVFVCLLPGLAEAQATSYLVSKFLSETSCLWSGAGCASGTCTVRAQSGQHSSPAAVSILYGAGHEIAGRHAGRIC